MMLIGISEEELIKHLNNLCIYIQWDNNSRSFKDTRLGELEYKQFLIDKCYKYIPVVISNLISIAALVVSILK